MTNCFSFCKLRKWLEGIFEDEPLLDELKYIYIAVNKSNNNIFFSMFAKEIFTEKIQQDIGYLPLEAQYYTDDIMKKTLSIVEYNVVDKYFINALIMFAYYLKKNCKFCNNRSIVIGNIFDKCNFIL